MTITSIDIGTNTILLLIAEIKKSPKAIKVILDEQKIPRIGEGLKSGAAIHERKQILLIEILRQYKDLSNMYGAGLILINATNAFRIASNKNELVSKIKNILDLDINVIHEHEEARLTFLGCALNYSQQQKLVVIDIGGGSSEIIFGMENTIDYITSLPIGAVTLTEKYFRNDPPTSKEFQNCIDEIRQQLKSIAKELPVSSKAIAVAGTPTTLAYIKCGLDEYDESKIEGYNLTLKEIVNFSEQLALMSSSEVQMNFKAVVAGREDVLLAGTILLKEIMRHLRIESVIVSARGLRYGAVFDYLLTLARAGSFE